MATCASRVVACDLRALANDEKELTPLVGRIQVAMRVRNVEVEQPAGRKGCDLAAPSLPSHQPVENSGTFTPLVI